MSELAAIDAKLHDFDLVSRLDPDARMHKEFELDSICPDDGKYGPKVQKLRDFLSARAEWKGCLDVQGLLMEARREYGLATEEQVVLVREAIKKADPLNIALLEEDKRIRHDQLAVLEELGRYLPVHVKALMHPGTTSYDILDTTRAYLFKRAWTDVIRPEANAAVKSLCAIAEDNFDVLQVGRTHLQYTSPVPLGLTLSGFALRLAKRIDAANAAFHGLRGKISGIVGTGAGIQSVFGKDNALTVEKWVLSRLGLRPDYASTQITPKEPLTDVGHSLVGIIQILGALSEDLRKLYSSDIQEVASKEKKSGGSSTDATKDNPIDWENIAGNVAIVQSGMTVLYAMVQSDFQRDLRNSRQGRYQPQHMMAEVYESLTRFNKAIGQLWINREKIAEHLNYVRKNPGDAMTTILKGAAWTHPEHGDPHTFVKKTSLKAKIEGKSLLEVAKSDKHFAAIYEKLPGDHQQILSGEIERYIGDAYLRARFNLEEAKAIVISMNYKAVDQPAKL